MVRASVSCLPYFLQALIILTYAGCSILGLVKVWVLFLKRKSTLEH